MKKTIMTPEDIKNSLMNGTVKEQWIAFSYDTLLDDGYHPENISEEDWNAFGDFMTDRCPEGPNGTEDREWARAFYFSIHGSDNKLVMMTSSIAYYIGTLYKGLNLY